MYRGGGVNGVNETRSALGMFGVKKMQAIKAVFA